MKFKKRYIAYTIFIGYLLFAHSCITLRTSTKKTKKYFNDKQISYKDTTLQIQDRDIHYLQTGNENAQSIVFIHGSPGSWSAWRNYLSDSLLQKKYRLISPDRPGFGYSNFRKSLDLTAQAEILNAFLSKLDNGEPITLIGHSYGGPLIAKMALEAPDLYKNLMILSGALDPNAEKPEKWRIPLRWFPIKYLVPGALKPSNDELWFLKEDLISMQPDLKNLSQNITIIHGTEDSLVPYSNVDFMKENFLNVRELKLISLENEDHFIVWSRETLIKETITHWVK